LEPQPPAMTSYWFSCRSFTIQVNVEAGIITWTAPIARKFIGQPFANLQRWQPTAKVVILA
jgi:hypothetical protein